MPRLIPLLLCFIFLGACASDHRSDQQSEDRSEQVPEDRSEQVPEQRSEQVPEQQSEQVPEQQSEQVPEQRSEVERVVIVGDSIARQIFAAADVLAPLDVEVTYLISVGPAFAGGEWPAPLLEFVPEPAVAAVIVSFGTWQASPPPSVEDQLLDLAEHELQVEIRAYLEPFAELGLPNGPALWLRPSVDDVEANDLLQRANALIEPIASELDVRTDFVIDGTDELAVGRSAVRVEGVAYPLRNDDATHYCPAPALVIARTALLNEGLVVRAPTESDVAQLIADTVGHGLFQTEGCEALVPS